MPLGPVMVGIAGKTLSADEERLLRLPTVGGVILFSRNFENPAQLAQLTGHIRHLREPKLLIGVDHEGGRVQRFREGFTRLPAMALLGEAWGKDSRMARTLARATGWVLAAELRTCGVDFSFAPVVDLNHGRSGVVGDRALHRSPAVVAELAGEILAGMRQGGMTGVAKHFPGHGWAELDSHHALPEDERPYADIAHEDLQPFSRLIDQGLAAIMPAHVVYREIDREPAGFSRIWLQDILRGRLRFQGAIFSDDLGMQGAAVAGGIDARVRKALAAGCDMVLVCNELDSLPNLLTALPYEPDARRLVRLARMHGRPHPALAARLERNREFIGAQRLVAASSVEEADLWGADPTAPTRDTPAT